MHTRKITAILTALLFAAFLASPFSPAEANSEKEEELTRIKQEMQWQQNKAAQAQQKVVTISEQLRHIHVELEAITKEYQDALVKLEMVEQQININSAILDKVEKSLAVKMKLFNKRVRDIYQNGQINYLDVLLGSADFNDFATRAELLKRIVSKDIALVTQIKAERNIVVQKKKELEQNYALLEKIKEDIAANMALIESRKKEQERMLRAAVDERDTAERSYEELMATSRQIEAMLRNGQGLSDNLAGSGILIWPVSGPITSPFGNRIHPIFGTARFHTGIDIAASYGEAVSAADGGVVVFSGWMGGYGKAIIINHGNGISTLYAHNSELVVSEGATVRKGQVICYIGTTGYSTGPHLHFEVRENGSPVNPLGYL